MEDCDEDVIFEGSALYHHLVSSGYESELEVFHKIPDEIETELENNDCSPLQEKSSKSRSNIVSCILGINYDSLVIEVAKQAIDSKLLVDEDVDFLKNFLQLELKAKKASGPALWSVPVAVGPLAFLASTSSSSVSRVLGLTGLALALGLSLLQIKQVFLHNRIVNSHRKLLESSNRLKSILNEARLL